MSALPLLHSVLVTQPVSQAAMARLGTFFSVELRTGEPVPGSEELVRWLQGKAGVIADTRYRFDASLIARLPQLKAICNLDAAHHNLDLQALTRAGIRATSLPLANSELRAPEASPLWGAPLPSAPLRQSAAADDPAGRYLSNWSRRVRFENVNPVHGSDEAGDLVAEQLIASLGFGRDSWHPRHLLNEDVQCESCC